MKAAIVKITPELLLQAMGFPKDTLLRNIRMDFSGRYIEATMVHDALPDVPEGCVLPEAAPSFRRVGLDSLSEFVSRGLGS